MAPFSASSLCPCRAEDRAGVSWPQRPLRATVAGDSLRVFTSSRRRLAKTLRLLDTAPPPAAFSRGSPSPAGTRTERALLETTQPPSHLWGPFWAHRTQGDLSIFLKK